MDEFRILLDRFWILRDRDRELYFQIRNCLPELRRRLRETLGWEIICNEKVIRLIKQPDRADAAFGIREFTSVTDYCLLCGLLLVLDDKDDGDRFLLSELTQALSAHIRPFVPELSWEQYSCRASLVRVLHFAETLGLLHVFDGESDGFAAHQEQEVLYENTGLSRWFSVNFHRDISGYTSVEDFERPPEEEGPDRERGIYRTWRAHRQLALAPAVYWQDPADPVYAYIKNQRGALQRNLDGLLGGKLQVYHNGAFFLPEPGEDFGDSFPRDQMLSDIVLLLCEQLNEKIQLGAWPRAFDGRVALTKAAFRQEVEDCRQANRSQWGKTAAERSLDALAEEVLEEMCYWGFAEREPDTVILLPAAALWHGQYPERRRKRNDGIMADE